MKLETHNIIASLELGEWADVPLYELGGNHFSKSNGDEIFNQKLRNMYRTVSISEDLMYVKCYDIKLKILFSIGFAFNSKRYALFVSDDGNPEFDRIKRALDENEFKHS